MIFFCLIGHSCWMFIAGGDAWFFGAPVLILVLVSPNTFFFVMISRGQRLKKSLTRGNCLAVMQETPQSPTQDQLNVSYDCLGMIGF